MISTKSYRIFHFAARGFGAGVLAKPKNSLLCAAALLAILAAQPGFAQLRYTQADQLVVQAPKEDLVVAGKTTFQVFLQNTMNKVVADVALTAHSKSFIIKIAPEQVTVPKNHRTYFDVTLIPGADAKPGRQTITFRLSANRQLIQEFSITVQVEEQPGSEIFIASPVEEPEAPPKPPQPQPPQPSPAPPAPSPQPPSQQTKPQDQPVFDETQRLTTRPTQVAPQIDGNLDEPEWKTSVKLDSFMTSDGAKPSFATTGLFLHDSAGIYIGLLCEDEDTAILTDKDTIEILFTRMPTAKPAFKLIMSPTGHVQIKRTLANGREVPWVVSGIQFATEKRKRAWSLELTVPFAAMGMHPPRMPERWFLRITRVKATGKQETAIWAPALPEAQPGPAGFGEIFLMPFAPPKPASEPEQTQPDSSENAPELAPE